MILDINGYFEIAETVWRRGRCRRIVVRGSRNVEFFYTVNGVRKSFRDHDPIQNRGEYAPPKEGATLDSQGWLRPEQKRALMQNGTYRQDGTINMETAHRLGWDESWRAKERPRPAPSPALE